MVNWTNNKDCSEKMWSNSSLFYATAWTFTHFTIRTLNISLYQMTLFFKLELTVLFSITFWRKRRFWVVSNASNNLKTCTNGPVSFSGTGLSGLYKGPLGIQVCTIMSSKLHKMFLNFWLVQISLLINNSSRIYRTKTRAPERPNYFGP